MGFSRPIFTAATLFCISTASAFAQSAEATFQRAVGEYKAAKTLRAEFQQTLTNGLTGLKASARGELLRKQPDLFSINFHEPASDRIVSDGKSVWLYLPSSAPGQVIKIPVKGTGGVIVDPLNQVLSSSKDDYTIKDAGKATINGRSTHAVTIVPKSNDGPFSSATIWVDEKSGIVQQIETKETGGTQRKIVITKYTTGVSFPASAFQFTVPPKVRVIDQAAMLGQ
jgi:outer membrane lipoprotein carrier protein